MSKINIGWTQRGNIVVLSKKNRYSAMLFKEFTEHPLRNLRKMWRALNE